MAFSSTSPLPPPSPPPRPPRRGPNPFLLMGIFALSTSSFFLLTEKRHQDAVKLHKETGIKRKPTSATGLILGDWKEADGLREEMDRMGKPKSSQAAQVTDEGGIRASQQGPPAGGVPYGKGERIPVQPGERDARYI